jgi:hypothetical protein
MIIQTSKILMQRICRQGQMLLFLCIASCSTGPTDDPIPVIPFADFTINLSFPEYQSLAVNGGTKGVNAIGVRGVLIYRKDASTYVAFERNCTYHPNDACATVNVHASGLYLTDPCCNSTFSFPDGMPTGGVAWRQLRRYRTSLSGTTLTIINEILP